jgi:hypothetical protein
VADESSLAEGGANVDHPLCVVARGEGEEDGGGG